MIQSTRREFAGGLAASCAVSLFGQGSRPRNTEKKRPNVLVVIADEWRAQSFGYQGDPNAPTAVFDRFARESVNFQQAISGMSVCCPARASLLTGQYSLTNGVYINDVELKPKGKTLGECFQSSGYRTGYIGKWHLYGSPDGHYGRREAFIPPDLHFGFEYWKAAECTHDYNRSFYYQGNDPTKRYWPGYDAQAQTDDACQFIKDESRGSKPWFLVLSWGPPHFPLQTAPDKYRKEFADRTISLRPNVPADKAEQATADLRGYYAHMAALDDCFAKILAAIDATGDREDTVVLFTSDHGDMMESQGLTTKIYPWEESVRVPFLLRYPRKFGHARITTNTLLSTPDIMPTLLGLAGIDSPATVEGTDFSNLRRKIRTLGPSDTAFLTMPVAITTAREYGIAEYRGVRNARYTYVRSIHGPWLLYDNVADPYQMRNLIGDPKYREPELRMKAQLDAWLHDLNDEFLPGDKYLERDHLTNYYEAYTGVIYTRSPWGDWESTMPARDFSVDAPLASLLGNPDARAVLQKELPQVLSIQTKPVRGLGILLSIRQLQHTTMPMSEEKIDQIEAELAKLPMQPRLPLKAAH